MSDDALVDCPACNKPELKKLISATGFRLSGGGWYETDFKSGGQKNVTKKESGASGSKPSGAVRAGDYKLIEWYEDNSVELYNLRDDIGEKSDLASKMPEKAAELRRLLHRWLRQIKATVPTPEQLKAFKNQT